MTSGGGLGETGLSGRRDVGVAAGGDDGTLELLLVLLNGATDFLYGLVVEACGFTGTQKARHCTSCE